MLVWRWRRASTGWGRTTPPLQVKTYREGMAAKVGHDLVAGTIPLTQSDWEIKPYRGRMGALKVRDSLEIVLDARLPAG